MDLFRKQQGHTRPEDLREMEVFDSLALGEGCLGKMRPELGKSGIVLRDIPETSFHH